jgi:hypothetical protein
MNKNSCKSTFYSPILEKKIKIKQNLGNLKIKSYFCNPKNKEKLSNAYYSTTGT